ncbi:unnamed protein product [Macrosiphum euphorbiae]|uniref:Uncharacterized protein n=1 Tax=Macrosiphum euphorbiae TaxID=13131 RepID=A0AAV0Y4Q5_9HEMI|nr:unnamed protein product [Macrosiphum euphorbiae]
MNNLNDRALVIMAIQQCCDIIFSSSSDDSEDDSNELYEYVVQNLETKTAIPRLQNYVETIVPQFNDGQLKSHFRMLPTTFEYVLTLIAPKLKRMKPGYKSISPNKQFLIAIWKMATPDSYRYLPNLTFLVRLMGHILTFLHHMTIKKLMLIEKAPFNSITSMLMF